MIDRTEIRRRRRGVSLIVLKIPQQCISIQLGAVREGHIFAQHNLIGEIIYVGNELLGQIADRIPLAIQDKERFVNTAQGNVVGDIANIPGSDTADIISVGHGQLASRDYLGRLSFSGGRICSVGNVLIIRFGGRRAAEYGHQQHCNQQKCKQLFCLHVFLLS